MCAGVCLGRKPGRARRGENVRVRQRLFSCIYCIYLFILNVAFCAHMSKILFLLHFYALYTDEQ